MSFKYVLIVNPSLVSVVKKISNNIYSPPLIRPFFGGFALSPNHSYIFVVFALVHFPPDLAKAITNLQYASFQWLLASTRDSIFWLEQGIFIDLFGSHPDPIMSFCNQSAEVCNLLVLLTNQSGLSVPIRLRSLILSATGPDISKRLQSQLRCGPRLRWFMLYVASECI